MIYRCLHLFAHKRSAWIYTFDSLGGRHPGAVNKLAKYLQHEAADKKGFPLEDTCIATYKHAKVSRFPPRLRRCIEPTTWQAPMQKNFCDCGLFVLAFVEAFMKDPVKSVERIRVRAPPSSRSPCIHRLP
ncbi:hypothetical protein C8Q73DRAFT_653171 [Cubamyces lactineus]|nr:hypothetical protein C8Q73DRAFT_653171 [Cubamyces lactineus]